VVSRNVVRDLLRGSQPLCKILTYNSRTGGLKVRIWTAGAGTYLTFQGCAELGFPISDLGIR